MRNEVLDTVTKELDAVAIGYIVDNTNKHIHLKFKVGDTPKTQVLPKTSSDWRAAKNARGLLRKTLKELGVQLAQTPVPRAPKPAKPVPVQPAIVAPISTEGWEQLRMRIAELEHALLDLQTTPAPAATVQHVVRRGQFIRPSLLRRLRKLRS